jgi:hypothetical protein
MGSDGEVRLVFSIENPAYYLQAEPTNTKFDSQLTEIKPKYGPSVIPCEECEASGEMLRPSGTKMNGDVRLCPIESTAYYL